MYNYRKYTKDESRDIAVVSTKHPQLCNCGICIAAKIYMKNLVKDKLELTEFDSHGRPIRSHRRKKMKFVEDKNFEPNGPFFRILDRRSQELEEETFPKAKSGTWSGYYMQYGEQHPFAMELEFQGNVLKGNGLDGIGKYTIEGTLDATGEVVFLKQYIGKHSIDYKGTLKENGREIAGTYTVGGFSESFTMRCEQY